MTSLHILLIMVRLIYSLAIFQAIQISSGTQSTQHATIQDPKSSLQPSENNLQLNTQARLLRSDSLNQCTIKFCQKCEKESDLCEVCKAGYDLRENQCYKKKNSSTDEVNTTGLIGIIVGVSLFSLIFCIV